jgi:hypothetical protein
MKRQRGISLSGLLIICVVLIAVVLLGFKLFPPYTEYLAIKKAINDIARNPEARGSAREIQAAYELRSAVEDFKSVRGTDLEIGRQGDRVTISAAWSVKVPLFYNINACIDFDVRSQ